MSDSSKHPEDSELWKFATGQLTGANAFEIESHLEFCPQCNQLLERLTLEKDPFVHELQRAFHGIDPGAGDRGVDPAARETHAHEGPGDTKTLGQTATPLETSRLSLESTADQSSQRANRVGQTVRYQILRPHARGGLGEVYVARDQDLGREVALKEIQPQHRDNPASRSRFILEAKVTGELEHPGIVPVYGLGQYADGRPFYVMRFIRGDTLKEAVDRHFATACGTSSFRDNPHLAFRKLLTHYLAVCNTVGYAHSRGILHRDLKPSNIMLGNYGETLVIDWGLAKVLGREAEPLQDEASPLPHASLTGCQATHTKALLGTPSFMSPEQAAGLVRELGPASDIYSLGAVLYYLLTGRAPFVGESLPTVLERIQAGDVDPPRQVRQQVPAPLEAVCLKAMSLKASDRYASASDIADEIEKWLADEPVSAYRESVWKRAQRRVRRHPTLTGSTVAAVAMGLVALVIGLTAVSFKNQQLAQTLLRERAAKSAKAAAQQQAAARLAQVVRAGEMMNSIFGDLAPDAEDQEGRPLRAILGERLRGMVTLLEKDAVGEPRAVASLQNNLAKSLLGLAETDKAIDLLTQARGVLAQHLGPDAIETLQTAINLGTAYREAGEYDRAATLLQDTLQRLAPQHSPDSPEMVAALESLSQTRLAQGNISEALELQQTAVDRLRKARPPDDAALLSALHNLALAYQTAGDLRAAFEVYQEVLSAERKLHGDEAATTLVTMNATAMCALQLGQMNVAMPLLKSASEGLIKELGPDHPHSLAALHNLAQGLIAQGQTDLAIPLLERALTGTKVRRGSSHRETMVLMANLAELHRARGNTEVAIPLLEQLLAAISDQLGADHPDALAVASNLASAYRATNRLEQARRLFEATLVRMKQELGPEHPNTLATMHNLAFCYEDQQFFTQSIALYSETLAARQRTLGYEHQDTLTTMANLGNTYRRAGDLNRAAELLEEALSLSRRTLSDAHPHTLRCMTNLGNVYLDRGDPEQAVTLCEEAAQGVSERHFRDPIAGQVVANLIHAYEQSERFAEAESWHRKWLAALESRGERDSAMHGWALVGLGKNMVAQNRPRDGELPLVDGIRQIDEKAAELDQHSSSQLREAIQTLIHLYEMIERKEDAARWKTRLESLPRR